jgi:hypothetical protein
MRGFWKSWLTVWCWATIGFGAMLAGAGIPGADGLARFYYDLIYWPLDGQSPFDADLKFTVAVLGAVVIGWAVAILGLIAAGAALGATAWRWLTACWCGTRSTALSPSPTARR